MEGQRDGCSAGVASNHPCHCTACGKRVQYTLKIQHRETEFDLINLIKRKKVARTQHVCPVAMNAPGR